MTGGRDVSLPEAQRASFQAELVRLGARFFIKHGTRPGAGIDVRRQRMKAYERWVPRPPAGVETVETRLGGVPASRIATPQSAPGRHILFLHGGAYVAGSAIIYRHITWRFAMAAEAHLAAIDYRLAPEHPFPAALDDATAAWHALLDEGADPRQCAVIGDSAGGGLALALALKLRDQGGPLPAAIVALSPWTDLAITGPSCRENAVFDPVLKSDDMTLLASQYLGRTDPRNPYVSPLYGDPRGLPPTLFQVGSDEILRDDSERMAERMREAGCDVTLEIWPRMPHVWHGFAPVLPEARRAILRVGDFVRRQTASRPIEQRARRRS
jgi:monoterpene epsilon-lactone hydrolase